jgi:hypothetical protein
VLSNALENVIDSFIYVLLCGILFMAEYIDKETLKIFYFSFAYKSIS